MVRDWRLGAAIVVQSFVLLALIMDQQAYMNTSRNLREDIREAIANATASLSDKVHVFPNIPNPKPLQPTPHLPPTRQTSNETFRSDAKIPNPPRSRSGNASLPRTAVLLVGNGAPKNVANISTHLELLKKTLVEPLDTDVFVASEYPDSKSVQICKPAVRNDTFHANGSFYVSYIDGSLKILETHVKSVSLTTSPETIHACQENFKHVRFSVKRHREYPSSIATGYKQWQKLSDAWKLMVLYEKERGQEYEIVFKIRFDCIPYPWDISKIRKMAMSSDNPPIRHMSDFAFWGRRSVMEKACTLGDYLDTWWLKERSMSNSRPFSVQAFYQSLINAPPLAWNVYNWRHFSKIGAMWFPNTTDFSTKARLVEGSGWHMVESLRVLLCHNVSYVDPLLPGSPTMELGILGKKNPVNSAGYFKSTERDFLAWMIFNNVTLCDIGGGVRHILYKGKEKVRRGYDRCERLLRENSRCQYPMYKKATRKAMWGEWG
ncbi:hypothetical protein AAMO2058_001395900 [Amorphochlora amoebiformis]